MTTTSRLKKNLRNCLNCKDEFTPNHGNRKHCTDECKIDYSNENARQRHMKRAFIDNKLKKNFEILERLIGNQAEITKSVEFMRGTGFDFNCHTQWVEYDGKQCRCVYEFIIAVTDQQTIKIIRNV